MSSSENSCPNAIIPPAPFSMLLWTMAPDSSDDEESTPGQSDDDSVQRDESVIDVVTFDSGEDKKPVQKEQPLKLRLKLRVPIVVFAKNDKQPLTRKRQHFVKVSASLTTLNQTAPAKKKKTAKKNRKNEKNSYFCGSRQLFRAADLAELNEMFAKHRYPSLKMQTAMAARFGVTLKQLRAWFGKRRHEAKKAKPKRHPPLPSDQAQALRCEAEWRLKRPDLPCRVFMVRNRVYATEYNVPVACITSYIRGNQVRNHSNLVKKKRIAKPVAFTKNQLEVLNQELEKSPDFWSFATKCRLATQIGVKPSKVNAWFCRKRCDGPSRLFTAEQYQQLEDAFRLNQLPSRQELESLAEKTGLKLSQVHTWVYGERYRRKMTSK